MTDVKHAQTRAALAQTRAALAQTLTTLLRARPIFLRSAFRSLARAAFRSFARATILVLLPTTVLLPTAHAFDILPEYQGLSEQELKRFETPNNIDSEYQSAVNAFTPDIDWEQRFQGQPKVLDLTVGSVGNKHFLQNHRLKLEADLLENLRFRLSSFQQRDREVDQTRNILELTQKLGKHWAISGYGEPSHYKRENDIGFALIKKDSKTETRLFYTLHDFTRKDHNDQQDRFAYQEPHSMGLIHRHQGEKIWSRLGLRYDQPSEWRRPQEQRIFEYSKTMAFADVVFTLNAEEKLTLRTQWDRAYKAENPDSPASSVIEHNWQLERRSARISWIKGHGSDFLQTELALMHAQRIWISNAQSELQHFNTLPSASAKWQGFREGSEDRVIVGYEANVFNMFGDLELTSSTQKRQAVEHRLQTAYQWSFQNQASLVLALNFDLDDWRTTPTFEGGNAQFRAEF